MDKYKQIINHLGINGRVISGSKSGYRNMHPEGYPVFNANIVVPIKRLLGKTKYEKVWYGDLDLMEDMDAINAAALDMDSELIVLREMDARFEYEDKPRVNHFICKTDGENITLGPGAYGLALESGKLVNVK